MATLSDRSCRDIVVIGASAGGLRSLSELIERLPPALPAAFSVVLHRSPSHESHLAGLLARRSALPVLEPAHAQRVEPGHVYLAPRDRHLLIQEGCFSLPRSAKVHFTRPAIDPLFESAATEYGNRVIGVLLSGGGHDGLSGLIAINAAGGIALVQDPGEAEFPWMPANAIWFDHVDAVLPIAQIADRIRGLIELRHTEEQHREARDSAPDREVPSTVRETETRPQDPTD